MFLTGNCTFDGTQFLVDGVKELDCFVSGHSRPPPATNTMAVPSLMDMHYTPALHAQEPSISYVKTPANFTSHYTSAQTFTTKECKVWQLPYLLGSETLGALESQHERQQRGMPLAGRTLPADRPPCFHPSQSQVEKTFGEPMDKVLYVFDETSPLPNASQLVQQINAEVVSVLATLTGIS